MTSAERSYGGWSVLSVCVELLTLDVAAEPPTLAVVVELFAWAVELLILFVHVDLVPLAAAVEPLALAVVVELFT